MSTKEQIVRTAERLFAERGLDAVSLRQIGAAAGCANHSVVQYHFGSKQELIAAILEFRHPRMDERRRMLAARQRPDDLRGLVECYVLPILEQGEEADSHFLSFVAVLQASRERRVFYELAGDVLSTTDDFRARIVELLPDVPEPLRAHRLSQAIMFSVYASADRERAQAEGLGVLPFAVHVSDLLDGLIGFLTAPVSTAALAALKDIDPKLLGPPVAS